MSGEAPVSRTVRVSPRTVMPEMCFAFPASYACTPTMSAAKLLPGPSGILGLSARSIENLNVWAVTGAFEGGEKRKPGLIVNV